MAVELTLRERFNRAQRVALGVAVVAGAAAAFGYSREPKVFLQSWLLGFLYWIALPLGSLALSMLHLLTGGSWGFAIRRLLQAAMRTLPLFVALFVPVALGVHELYEWSHEDVVARDPILAHKAAYLNTTGFLVRTGVYFAIWLTLAWRLDRLSNRHDQVGGSKLIHKMRVVAGPGIALYGLAMTFAAIDWAMSLEPHWFSTIYGVMFLIGQGLATLAFSVAFSAWLSRREPFKRWLKADHYHDLGKLMFAFVMLWAYVSLSQFLIIWSANTAEEMPWYLKRTAGGWDKVALANIAFHFFLPFAVLLSAGAKRNAKVLASIAVFLLGMRLVDLFWLIVPAFSHGEPSEAHFEFHWLYLATPLAIGGLWFAFFLQQLKGRPLVSLQDAHLESALEASPSHGSAGSH